MTFGVMQGRLLPKYEGRYQAFPIGYWQNEFDIAKSLGVEAIEFILDYNDAEENPLLNEVGVNEIKMLSSRSGVLVKTICADYFMEAPLHSANKLESRKSMDVLLMLLEKTRPLGITDIVIPCVDQSSLAGEDELNRFVSVIKSTIGRFEEHGVNISLETDLPPKAFQTLLKLIDSDNVKVNYDIGNSAALGFDPIEELDCYGAKISDIHIKDRVLNGGPVTLGSGAADFECFFSKLAEFDYQGPFIMQAYRDDEGVEIFKQQMEWVSPYLSRYSK